MKDFCEKKFGTFGTESTGKTTEIFEEEVFGTDNLEWAGLNFQNYEPPEAAKLINSFLKSIREFGKTIKKAQLQTLRYWGHS